MPSGIPTTGFGTLCKIDGCDRTVAARGLCSGHYGKYRSSGWLDLVGDAPQTQPGVAAKARADAVLAKLKEQMGIYASARPAEFETVIRELGYYVTPTATRR